QFGTRRKSYFGARGQTLRPSIDLPIGSSLRQKELVPPEDKAENPDQQQENTQVAPVTSEQDTNQQDSNKGPKKKRTAEEKARRRKEREEKAPKTVTITLIGVKDVAAMDSNGKSDPFVKVLFGGEEKGKTKKVADTLNAEFNETFKFKYDRETQDTDIILFELWDHDALSDDDQIGKAEVPLGWFIDNKEEAEITFEGVNKQSGTNVGVLEAEIEAIPYDSGTLRSRNQFGTRRKSYFGARGQTLRPSIDLPIGSSLNAS
ncbi:MAG: hypothetical protein EZS28_051284, partial [Streblomastix strix]